MKKIFTLLVLMLAVVSVQAVIKNKTISLANPTGTYGTWENNAVTWNASSNSITFSVSGVDKYTSVDVYVTERTNNFRIYLVGKNGEFAFNSGTAYGSTGLKSESTNQVSTIGSITGIKIVPANGASTGGVTLRYITFNGIEEVSNTVGLADLTVTEVSGYYWKPTLVSFPRPFTNAEQLVGYTSTRFQADVTDYHALYFEVTSYSDANGQLRAMVQTTPEASVTTRYAHKVSDEVTDWTSANTVDGDGLYYIDLSDVKYLNGIKNGSQNSNKFTINNVYLATSSFSMNDGKDAGDIVYDPIKATVAYDRSFTADTKSTVCLPFDLTQDEADAAGTFYEMTAASASGITFTKVTSGGTTAYKPYIFEAKTTGTPFSNITNKEVEASADATTSYSVGGYTFHGTLAAGNVSSGAYGYSGGAFKKAGTGVTIKAFRGYITYEGPGSAPALLNINFGDGSETTGISDATRLNNNEEIRNNNVVYNLQGQRVSANHKGIVIKNGKKYFVK